MDINFQDYILKEMIILIPTLYGLGMFFKASKLHNEFIPATLLILGIVFATCINGFNIYSIIQGILTSGTAVFFNQLIKQNNKIDY